MALKAKIAEMRLRGRTYMEISKDLGISEAYAASLYSQCVKEWKAAQQASVAEHRSVQLAKVDEIEKEAWRELERLKERGLEMIAVTDAGSKQTTTRRVRTATLVDTLGVIAKCVDMRSKLLGLYSPEQVAIKMSVSKEGDREPSVIDLRLAEYADAFERARLPAPEGVVSGDGPGQSLDSGQASSSAGAISDADGRIWEHSA